MTSPPTAPPPAPPALSAEERLRREDEGYHKGLKPRQLQMIAIGGAIGTGLFLGAGGRVPSAGAGVVRVFRVSDSAGVWGTGGALSIVGLVCVLRAQIFG